MLVGVVDALDVIEDVIDVLCVVERVVVVVEVGVLVGLMESLVVTDVVGVENAQFSNVPAPEDEMASFRARTASVQTGRPPLRTATNPLNVL